MNKSIDMNNIINMLQEKDRESAINYLNSIVNPDVVQNINASIAVPMVEIREAGNQIRTYDLFSSMLKDRNVLMIGEVHDGAAAIVTASLLYLDSISDKPITMYINSPGGSISSGLSMYDTMMHVKAPLTTIGYGMCASMGAFLLSAGKNRNGAAVLPNTVVMIHQPLGGIQGQATDMQISTERILQEKERLNKLFTIFISRELDPSTGKYNIPYSDDELYEIYKQLILDTDRDNFMNAEEAVEYGLVDKIIYSAASKETKENLDRLSSIIERKQAEETPNTKKIIRKKITK